MAPNYLSHAQSQAALASAVAARQQVGNQWQGTSLDGTTWRLFPPKANVPQWRGYPLFQEAVPARQPAGGWLQLKAAAE